MSTFPNLGTIGDVEKVDIRNTSEFFYAGSLILRPWIFFSRDVSQRVHILLTNAVASTTCDPIARPDQKERQPGEGLRSTWKKPPYLLFHREMLFWQGWSDRGGVPDSRYAMDNQPRFLTYVQLEYLSFKIPPDSTSTSWFSQSCYHFLLAVLN